VIVNLAMNAGMNECICQADTTSIAQTHFLHNAHSQKKKKHNVLQRR